MKRFFEILAVVALVASCSKVDDVQYNNEFVLTGYSAVDSRTEFGTPEAEKIPYLWSEGDYIWVGSVKSKAISDSCKAAQFKWDNEPSTFGDYHVFYNMTGSDKNAKVLAVQTADGNLGNDGDFGYALADEYKTFVLEHKTSYIWFDTTSNDVTEKLVSISVTAVEGIALAGERAFDYANDAWGADVVNGVNSVVLNFGEGVALKASNEGVFAAMVTLPAAVSGTELTILYTFADGTTFTEVKQPQKDLTAGAVQRVATTIAAADLKSEPQMRVLTFEDEDAKFATYTLDYCSRQISTWSDLVDDAQYNGPLTYDANGGTYYWHDEGNTELFHSFTTPYWTGGHAISNYVIADYTTLPDGYYGWYELQFANPIGGHNGSANFAVHNGYSDFFNSQIYDASLKGFEFADGVARVIDHMYITNTCYVLNSLTVGDGFAPPATDGTVYKVVAYGYDASDNLTGSSEFILCEGTNPVTEWQKWELKGLGEVVKVLFNFEPSSDLIGDYGMNTPAYFAYDDVAVIF